MPDEIKKILTELRTYNPKADEYGGEHIIPGWADRIEKALRLNSGSKANGRAMKPHEFRALVNELRDIPAIESKRELIVKSLKAFNINPAGGEIAE